MDIKDFLFNFRPIHEFNFGHTPYQVKYFKTTSQKGCREFEYWQHVLQLRQLDQSLKEADLEIDELEGELEDAESFWPFWNRRLRRRKVARLKHKLEQVKKRKHEQTVEAERHIKVIQEDYKDLMTLTEDEIFAREPEYWVTRLTRQVALGHLGNKLGISSGDLTAISSLPQALQESVFSKVAEMVQDPNKLLAVATQPLLGEKNDVSK